MKMTFQSGGRAFRFDSLRPIDISIPLDFHGQQPNAFHLPRAEAVAAEAGAFVGDTRRGGSCNCETITFNPHGNGTHTECVGHITSARVAISSLLVETLLPATLVTVEPESWSQESSEFLRPGDVAITWSAIERAVAALDVVDQDFLRALVIRTAPNLPEKRNSAHSGTNPPYVTAEAMRFIREFDVDHLLVDLPSVDPEDDGGFLSSHRIFWEVPAGAHEIAPPYPARTITEMVYVEDAIADGRYLLDLQIPPFQLDAAPSRPILYAIEEIA
jgi:hypothetical protein